MKASILAVDDEPAILELVSYNLEREGFTVDKCTNGEEALNMIKGKRYDLMLLDLMLPGIQGIDLCKIIKSSEDISSLPVIMLTAKGTESDRVLGLETGADDYITKPFSPRELAARVRAVLRRTRSAAGKAGVIKAGEIEINTETYEVRKRGRLLNLSPTEFRLLLHLVQRRGRVFSRSMLLDAVWRDEAFVEPRTVDVHIRRLRTQIEDDPSDPVYIKTRRGVGYYMNAEL
jgi:phosphate regulon transcriptional regulator PhoB